MNQEGKEGSRVFLIPDEAQKKNLTSFSLDAERIRGPSQPELSSCSKTHPFSLGKIKGRGGEETKGASGIELMHLHFFERSRLRTG
jgi:hypothetical protein